MARCLAAVRVFVPVGALGGCDAVWLRAPGRDPREAAAMTWPSVAGEGQALERRAFSLGTANAIDFALQFVLPIVLTRALDSEDFCRYLLLGLAVVTLTLAPTFKPHIMYDHSP